MLLARVYFRANDALSAWRELDRVVAMHAGHPDLASVAVLCGYEYEVPEEAAAAMEVTSGDEGETCIAESMTGTSDAAPRLPRRDEVILIPPLSRKHTLTRPRAYRWGLARRR